SAWAPGPAAPPLLVARLAVLPEEGPLLGQPHAFRRSVRRHVPAEPVHLAAQPVARSDPRADHVGLHPGGGDHLPARIRLGLLPNGAGGPDTLPGLRVWLADLYVRPCVADRPCDLPRPGLVVVPGDRRGGAGAAPAAAGPRGRRTARLSGRPAAAVPAVRDQRHGAAADGQLHLAEGLRLRVPGHHA